MRWCTCPGHPRRNELREMYEWIRPQIAIPVHGEAAHLVAHAKLARTAGIADVPQGAQRRSGPACAGQGRIIDAGAVRAHLQGWQADRRRTRRWASSERRKLSFAGHVAVNVVLDDRYELAGDPDLVALGAAGERRRRASRWRISCSTRHAARSTASRARAARISISSRGGAPRRARRGQRRLGQEADRDGVRDEVN